MGQGEEENNSSPIQHPQNELGSSAEENRKLNKDQNQEAIPENYDTGVAPYLKEMQPQLQNVVATFNVGVKLDLKNIAMKARNAEYNPKRFAAVVMRIRKPKTTALIFENGKLVVTGARDEDQSREASRQFTKIIQKLGYEDAKRRDFTIQNIVGSCDVRFPIRLEGLCYCHNQWTSYEPEMFPGLVFRMEQPKIVLLIFCSGKIVLTGAKRREEIYQAFNKIYPVLCDFKKEDAQTLIQKMNTQQAQLQAEKLQQEKQQKLMDEEKEKQRIQAMKDVKEMDKVLESLNNGFSNHSAAPSPNMPAAYTPAYSPPAFTPAYTPAYAQEDYDAEDLE